MQPSGQCAGGVFTLAGKRSQGQSGDLGENPGMRTSAYVLLPGAGCAAVFFVLLFAVVSA
jgi:hypothetical protein